MCKSRPLRFERWAVEEIGVLPQPMGIITVIDVIEHLDRPLEALRKLRSWLTPGGTIILFTGATDSLACRLFGRHYWYSALPEHVSFYSLRWFQWAARELNMKVAEHHYLSSIPFRPATWTVQFLKQAAYGLAKSGQALGIPEWALAMLPGVRRARHWRNVPWFNSARDHILIALSSTS